MKDSSPQRKKVEKWDLWKEFLQFEKEVDKLFDHFLKYIPLKKNKHVPTFSPAADVYQTSSETVIRIALPGVIEDEIDILVERSHVIVRAERIPPSDIPQLEFVHREWRYGMFEKRIELDHRIRREHLSARFDEGILEIRIPLGRR